MDNPDLAFMAKMIFDLFIVIALIVILIYVLRRFQAKRSKGNHHDKVARIQQTIPLGNKNHLHVISWQKKEYLIGMTNGNGFVIDRFDVQSPNIKGHHMNRSGHVNAHGTQPEKNAKQTIPSYPSPYTNETKTANTAVNSEGVMK